ncbi:tripartite tricarboxylate transporter TctB family protein [Clostridium sp. AM58-1XD]|uniref:tripartite tricarboxylate transporter TctB family protein n=1 Tax=Clostridium sp. AM58-1XD TaxID=2292307 RepID=UPI000E4B7F1D|nr:tripartite tricarboxylate transporter TctB family protein [Clostridium sp. AM58-1XD]RGY99837.1 tripartite tricarboxylate transporter TctB family protein [Clostridium sp. AM58-1XD]
MNILFSILAILTGLYWMIKGTSYKLWVNHGPGGGVFPVIAGLLIVVFGIVYLIGEIRKKSVVKFEIRMVYPIAAVLAAVLFSYAAGLIAALSLFVTGWLKCFEKYGWVKSICLGAGTGLVLFLIFDYWLKIPVPVGKIAELFSSY